MNILPVILNILLFLGILYVYIGYREGWSLTPNSSEYNKSVSTSVMDTNEMDTDEMDTNEMDIKEMYTNQMDAIEMDTDKINEDDNMDFPYSISPNIRVNFYMQN